MKENPEEFQFIILGNVENIQGEKYAIFTNKGYFRINSKLKHSEIWNKFIKFQRNNFVEQPTNKV